MDILKVLRDNNFSFSKKYGQNFITDTNLLRAIVSDSNVEKTDNIIEVGCGAGTLTKELADASNSVVGFEIDKNLIGILNKTVENDNVRFIFEDVLNYTPSQIDEIFPNGFKLVANLPYYITTPIIFHFLECKNLKAMTIMVQKEVALRICAKENSKDYGALTVQLGVLSDPKITRIVNRNLFTPAPNVDSAIVHLVINKKPNILNYPLLKKVIASGFAMRRKTLVNNLSSSFSLSKEECVQLLKSLGLNENIRGEALSIIQFIDLANALDQLKK